MMTHFNAYDITPFVTDSTTPVWFSLGHTCHAPIFGSFSQSARQLNSSHGQLKNSNEALSNSHFTVILFLLSHVLIFSLAIK
jgi:hypothetical protein